LPKDGIESFLHHLPNFIQPSQAQSNMDIELAVDAMEMAPHVDHIVLFSGDGDFRSLVEAVQRRGVRVTVVSLLAPSGLSGRDASLSRSSGNIRPFPKALRVLVCGCLSSAGLF